MVDGRTRYRRAVAIVEATDGLDEAAREALVARECAGDDALRAEVEWLLRAMQEEDPAPPPPQDLSGAVIGAAAGSDYRLLHLLGRGGMGAVYLAERRFAGGSQQVALKLLDPGAWPEADAARRLASEARILARLSHRHIARLLDAGRLQDGRPFLAMEYVEGERIDRWCDARALPLAERLRLFLKVCDAVEYAHRHLVIHRDLKPSNILVDAGGEPRLLDFGIARLLDGAADAPTGTAHHALTLSYASPEQIRNEPLSTASDVWQLGVVLYELVSGVRPFPVSAAPLAVSHAILSGEPAPPGRAPGRKRAVPVDVDAIVMKAMRSAPGDRYASVAELAADLRRFLASRPVHARRGRWWYRLRRFVGRHRAGVAVGVAFVALLAGFAAAREEQLRAAQRERDRAQAMVEFMQGLFEDADPSRTRGNRITVAEALDLGVARLEAGPALEPATRAALLVSIGRGYTALDMGHHAVPLLREADALLAQAGAPMLERGRTKAALRRAYSMALDTASAIAAGREAIELLRRAGAADTEILRVRINLLYDHLTVGDTPLPTLRDELVGIVAGLEAAPGSDRELLIQALAVLSMVEVAAGEDAVAARHAGRALAIAKDMYGPEDPALIYYRFTDSLARIRSDPAGAVRAYREQIADYERMNDRPTPGLGALYTYAGRALAQMGQGEEALGMLVRGEEIARGFADVAPDFHLNVLSLLAAQYQRLGRAEEAERLLQPWLERMEARAGTGAAWAVNGRIRALNVLGDIALARGADAEAADRFRAALDTAARHADVAASGLRRASADGLCRTGRVEGGTQCG